MQVVLWTDVVCPWCYIGVSRFERALNASGVAGVNVRIHPFQLDPDAPIPGRPSVERYRQKFGNEAGSIVARVTEAARADGLAFDLGRAVAGNTFDAHRAIRFAQMHGKGSALEMALYRAYFADGLDVSDRNVLADRAANCGLDRDRVSAYLAGDDGVDEIRQELERALTLGISGVPSFLFNNEFLVPGALDEAGFVRVLQQMSALPGTPA